MAATFSSRPQRPLRQPLSALCGLLGLPDPTPDPEVSGVTHDSRSVRPGDLYAALPGLRTHGARFTAEAIQRGAVAVLTDPTGWAEFVAQGGLPESCPVLNVDHPREVLGEVAAWAYGDPSADLEIVAVTGTDGKTTTAHLIESGLRVAGHLTGLVGTIDTRVAGESLPSVRTTPEATDLQALFAVMRERGVRFVVMEVSSHALALGRVNGTRFAAGLFTNLSQDHLDFHHDMESYFAAKAQLFDGRCRHEIVNVDDPYGRRLVKDSTVTVSAAGDPAAAWRASEAVVDRTGTHYLVDGPDGLRLRTVSTSPGEFNVANQLLAVAALVTLGVPAADAVSGTALIDVPGRMQAVLGGQQFLAVIDYAHTPDAVAKALAALRERTEGRVIVVLGAGGDRDRDKRPLMGEAAARGADLVIVTDDNPRSEDPAQIRAAVAAGARRAGGGDVVEIGDRREAIAEAVRRAGPEDALLVAGKGHERGQEIDGVVHPFDDREVLESVLERADWGFR
ncbi:MAG: UDP-N-acetylmuramoyl-L-alanyl-D-glutamate--2,6-diaminopimelate ligase [Mycobacteriales bacterium]